jgi:glutathione-specific gamma-glutamylcyclotransferase
MPDSSDLPVWLFAYGSLLWRPGFEYVEQARGYVTGWSRRFWQGSTDHRGLPGAPGRVVTLAAEPQVACWGVAYRLDPGAAEHILRYVDHREQGGYERHVVDFYCAEGPRCGSWPALLYVAGPHKPNHLGPAALADIALQVRSAAGPSGTNREYVLKLHDALAALEIVDEHVSELAALLAEPPASAGQAQRADADGHAEPRGTAF